MGIEYYAFALFISGLICLIAILCRVLFADHRRQHKLIDEKETKLLRLYQSVEDLVEEFNNQADEIREEIKRQGDVLAAREAALRTTVQTPVYLPPERYEKAGMYVTADSVETSNQVRHQAASRAVELYKQIPEKPVRRDSEIINGTRKKPMEKGARQESAVSFQRMIDDIIEEQPVGTKNSKNESILMLKEKGKTISQIAQELGITQNEVNLVIGLNS